MTMESSKLRQSEIASSILIHGLYYLTDFGLGRVKSRKTTHADVVTEVGTTRVTHLMKRMFKDED